MFASLLKLTGLILLPGGLLFYMLVWYPLTGKDTASCRANFHNVAGRLLQIGGGLYVAGILLQTWQLYQLTLQSDPGSTPGAFMLNAAHALPLLNLLLVPILIFGFTRMVSIPALARLHLPGLLIVLMLLLDTAGSHAAADPGLLPYLGNVIHLFFAIIWAGGLFYLWLLTRQSSVDTVVMDNAQLHALDHRFYRLVLLMFIAVVTSGSILGFVHVHSEAALYSTAYGNALVLKLVLVLAATLLLAYHVLVTSPALQRSLVTPQTDPVLPVLLRYRRRIIAEAFILSGLLIATAVMRSHTPPDTTPFLNPQTFALTVEGQAIKVTLQPVAGSLDSVRMEFFLPAALAGGDNTRVYFMLDMVVNGLEIPEAEALRVSPNSYQGEATFPIPGDWQLHIRIAGVDGNEQQLTSELKIPKQPLVEDIATYLSPQAVVYSSSRLITFGTGLLLVFVYGWILSRRGHRGVPPWAVLAGTGGVLFGLYLVCSVALVKTYPSTYRQNPLPLKASVVARGQLAYQNNCAECHGPLGEGDGPWAITNRGAIPSLVSPHLDVHTDGEIYWWIVRGIPELDMPPREQQLDEDQRWELINYLRSLRHGSEPG